MGEGLNIPFQVIRWRGWSDFMHRVLGSSINVTPQLFIKLGARTAHVNTIVKVLVLVLYVTWQLYIQKGYLHLAEIEGTSRLQLQHPVQHCNPLHRECKADFAAYDDLAYCTQHKGKVNTSEIGRQEQCEYLDEFDVKLPGYQQDNMMIPTRTSTFTQKVLCTGREGPCKQKYEFGSKDTFYVADIESFTLLIDHSIVCPELGIRRRAWDMVGLYSPCESLAKISDGECPLQPIRRVDSDTWTTEMKDTETASFAMWMDTDVTHTFLPFMQNSKKAAAKAKAPFFKIPQGDIISVKNVLAEIGVDLDAPTSRGETKRYSGMVLVIDIEYRNYRTFTWPNKLPPVYTYTFKLSPADEYKVVEVGKQGETERKILDQHGIYIIVNKSGRLGEWSWRFIFLMILGGMAILTVQRYIVTMYALHSLPGKAGDDLENEIITVVAVESGKVERAGEPYTPLTYESGDDSMVRVTSSKIPTS